MKNTLKIGNLIKLPKDDNLYKVIELSKKQFICATTSNKNEFRVKEKKLNYNTEYRIVL